MADSIGGYPTSPLERFVGGFQSGYEKMTDIRKKSDDLKTQLAVNAKNREAAGFMPKSGGGSDSSTSQEGAYDTGGTTGSGGGSGGSGGGSGGSGGGGEWGNYAAPIMDYFKKAGYSDAAVQGIMANGLAEGGFGNNWKPGDQGSSFGHWQFHEGGELNGYRDWAAKNGVTDLKDSLNQAKFVDYRMNQIDPNFKNITDPRAATNQFMQGFERPKNQQTGIRDGHLATAQRYISGAPAGAPSAVTGSSAPPVQPGAAPASTSAAAPAAPLPSAFDVKDYSTALQPSTGGLRGSQPPAEQRLPGLAPMHPSPPPPYEQQSAIGGLGAQPPPDIYNRPQAPPPPSVLAQLVGQQYLPQQNASLSPQQDAGWMNSFSQSPRQAPDGNHYLPDPSRPGKYLMVG